ncbi:hypothetical protein H4R33_006709 [Dimargaris cristalligena]|nr:hypothetical protein H4R33_006709 [Dimargaris cristalligena]
MARFSMTSSSPPSPTPPNAPGAPSPHYSQCSCLTCRKRKIRCDRLLPRCTSCQQWDSECQYELTPARLRKALARATASKALAQDKPSMEAQSPAKKTTKRKKRVKPVKPVPRVRLVPLAPATKRAIPPKIPQNTVTKPVLTEPEPKPELTPTPTVAPELPDVDDSNFPFILSPVIPRTHYIPPRDQNDDFSTLSNSPIPANLTSISSLILPLSVFYSAKRLCLANLVVDNVNQRTARLLFKLLRGRPSSANGVPYLDQISHLAEQERTSTSSNGLDISKCSPANFRSMFVSTDLIYHSDVVRHSLEDFCTFIYKGHSPLQRLRVMYRLENRLISEPFQLATMMAMAPFSDHPVFDHIPPDTVNVHYHSKLVSMLPTCLAESSPDMFGVLGVLAETTLGLGLFDLHQSLIAASTRKQQSARIHIIDHPNPPPQPGHLISEADSLIDAPTIRDEFLRDHYRTVWWTTFSKDVLSALVFGYEPLVDFNDCCVNLPRANQDAECRLDMELANPLSDIFTSTRYPTMLVNSRIKNSITTVKAKLSILGNQVAKLRARQASDPESWLRALPQLNQELERWYDLFAEVAQGDYRLFELTSALPSQREADALCFRVRVLCSMMIIHLNHFDGYSPDSMEPFPGSALCNALQAAGKSVDCTLTECHERCWSAVLRLREFTIDSSTPPGFINNTVFISALYPAAILCNERFHGMGSVDPFPVKRADRELASDFINKIIQILDSFGQLWKANLKLVEDIRVMRNSPFSRRSLTIKHIV